jgi:17beta-estradiol 17-dehydrogenase / very-long-chain 3-oxoacyl-CoA reductase
MDDDCITATLNINAMFPFFLTKAFLPSLRRTSRNGPVEIVFIGSFAGDVAVPFIAPYAGSKALIKRVSRIMHADERAFSKNSNMSFAYANVGEVQSGNMNVATTPTRPRSDDFAKYLVRCFGSGRRTVIPYPVHHVVFAMVTGMPEALCDRIVMSGGKSVARELKESKKER